MDKQKLTWDDIKEEVWWYKVYTFFKSKFNKEEKMSNKKFGCSYIDGDGNSINECEDVPVTFCKKCKCFYSDDGDGIKTQVDLKEEEEFGEGEDHLI
jgi:hypothetical protein